MAGQGEKQYREGAPINVQDHEEGKERELQDMQAVLRQAAAGRKEREEKLEEERKKAKERDDAKKRELQEAAKDAGRRRKVGRTDAAARLSAKPGGAKAVAPVSVPLQQPVLESEVVSEVRAQVAALIKKHDTEWKKVTGEAADIKEELKKLQKMLERALAQRSGSHKSLTKDDIANLLAEEIKKLPQQQTAVVSKEIPSPQISHDPLAPQVPVNIYIIQPGQFYPPGVLQYMPQGYAPQHFTIPQELQPQTRLDPAQTLQDSAPPQTPAPSHGHVSSKVHPDVDQLNDLLQYIYDHPKAQHEATYDACEKTEADHIITKGAAYASQMPLRDLAFKKRDDGTYDVHLPHARYTGPVFMPRLGGDPLAPVKDANTGKPSYDILMYVGGKLDPSALNAFNRPSCGG